MNKINVWQWMELDLDTYTLYVEWMKPFKVEKLSDAEQEWLEDWHKILENWEK